MLIVFEGPDGAGKTTIAYEVQRQLNATRTHCGPPHPTRAFEHWMQIVNLAANDPTHNIVCDRLHWGDAVYADKYRPDVGPQLSPKQFTDINVAITRAGGLFVHVTADAETLVERFDGNYIDPDDVQRLIDAYREQVDLTIDGVMAEIGYPPKIIKVDTSVADFDLSETVDFIVAVAAAVSGQ